MAPPRSAMMCGRGAWVTMAAALLLAVAAFAQSELVIHKEGTNLYHRAGCPVIAEGVGVLVMGRGQAESRGYKPHPECDPANAAASKAPPARGRRSAAPPPVTVYVDGSRYYHRKDCPRLTGASRKIEAKPLDEAGKQQWPCPTCRPPIRRKSLEPAVPGTERRRGR